VVAELEGAGRRPLDQPLEHREVILVEGVDPNDLEVELLEVLAIVDLPEPGRP